MMEEGRPGHGPAGRAVLDGKPLGARAWVWGSFWMCGPCRAGIKSMGPLGWTGKRKQKAKFGGDRSL